MTAFRVLGDPAASRGLHLGDGLFETILVRDGAAQRLAEHVDRIRRSGVALGVPVPDAIESVATAHLAALWDEERRPARAALRITVARAAWDGLAPGATAGVDVVLALRALPATAPDTPLRAVVLDAPRIDPASPLSGHKTLSWMTFVEARRRAVAAGADCALLRTTDGDVAEADAANVFAVVRGRVVTPPTDRGVLPGLTRARVLAGLRAAGEPVDERPLRDADLDVAEEVFTTSSLGGVRSVGEIGARRLPDRRVVATAAAATSP